MLEQQDLRISEIAYRLGYGEPANFLALSQAWPASRRPPFAGWGKAIDALVMASQMLFVALDLGEGSMAQASTKRPNVTPRLHP
jgi:AraC-like DNA-binding protein